MKPEQKATWIILMLLAAFLTVSPAFAHNEIFDVSGNLVCSNCHSVHDAPANLQPGIQRADEVNGELSSDQLIRADEKEVCYTCHNGTGATSAFDTQMAFGERGSTQPASLHDVPGGELFCSDCHTDHKKGDDLQEPHEANEVVRLVKVLISGPLRVTGFTRTFGYLINELNTAWQDSDTSVPYKIASRKFTNPNLACGSTNQTGRCHGTTAGKPITASYFTQSVHAQTLTSPASSTGIRCNRCHQWHASSLNKLLATSPISGGLAVNGNNNSQCFACHTFILASEGTTESPAYSGQDIYELTKHNTVTDSDNARTTWTAAYQAGYCINCHDPHGTAYPDMRRGRNSLCTGCHDAVSLPSKTVGYSYRGYTQYESSSHGSTEKSNQWPVSRETGALIGSGGGAQQGECINCHNPMGMQVIGLFSVIYPYDLLRWNYDTDSAEESLCFGGGSGCHNDPVNYTDGFYGNRTYSVFNVFNRTLVTAASTGGATVNNRHDIGYDDQNDVNSGAKVECSSCHNTHLNTPTRRLVDPDDVRDKFTTRYTTAASFSNGESYAREGDLDPSFGSDLPDYVAFCLRCHDNALPEPPGNMITNAFGSVATLNLSTAYAATFGADAHGRGTSGATREGELKTPYQSDGTYAAMNCTDCHDFHGDTGLYHLKRTVSINGSVLSPTADVSDNNYWDGTSNWCSTCHANYDTHLNDPAKQDCGDCHYHGGAF